jgi:hypothetical protein
MPTLKTAAITIGLTIVALIAYDMLKPSVNKLLGRA